MMIKVLLVDKPTIARQDLRALLEAEIGLAIVGHESDPCDAVALAWQLKPDVVVMACSFLESLDAIRALRSQTAGPRIVVLTAHQNPKILFELLQTGAHGLLLAETAGVTLVNAIRAVYGGGAFVCGNAAALMIPHYINRGGPKTPITPLESLSRRERQVLNLVVDGMSSSEIAQLLAISPKSVDTYRSRLMKKLGVTDLPSLVKFAIHHDLAFVERA